jgi:glycosyltransferase involved in cell wall biosynthesis
MRILFLTDKPPWPCDSGGAYGAWTIIRSLAISGHRLTILTIETQKHNTESDIPSAESEGIEKVITVFLNTRLNISSLLFNLLFSDKPYTVKRFLSGIFAKAILEESAKGYDVTVCEGINTAVYRLSFPEYFRGKVIYRPQNAENKIWYGLAIAEKNIFRRAYFRLIARRLGRIERDLANSFDAILPVSETDKEWFVNNGLRIPCAVMLPAVRKIQVRKVKSAGPGKLAFIGSLDWLPNIEGLKWFVDKCWPSISERIPGIKFHVAGKNPGKKTAFLRVHENIVFEGEVSSSEDFLKDKTVLISPLFSGSGIRIKILEALSMSVPVVATTVAASGIEINCPGLFISDKPEIFSEHILRLLNDDSACEKAGSEGSAFVNEKYDILNPAKIFNDLYSTINISS